MKDVIGRSLLLVAFALFAGSFPPASHGLTLTNGSIIGEDSVAPGGTSFTIVEYSQAGAIQQTLPITSAPGGYGTMSGLAIIGNRLWTVGSNGIVAEADLASGALVNSFSTGLSVEALGNLGSDLLVGQSNGLVRRYTTAGIQVGSDITLQASNPHVEGLDADSSHIYAASSSGTVYTFDLAGNLLSSFGTGDSLSGLGVDPATGNLWVSAGFGSDFILQCTTSGSFVSSFNSNRNFINGLDIMPEPASLMLLAAGNLLIAKPRRRQPIRV